MCPEVDEYAPARRLRKEFPESPCSMGGLTRGRVRSTSRVLPLKRSAEPQLCETGFKSNTAAGEIQFKRASQKMV